MATAMVVMVDSPPTLATAGKIHSTAFCILSCKSAFLLVLANPFPFFLCIAFLLVSHQNYSSRFFFL